jgi:hypothetical protein
MISYFVGGTLLTYVSSNILNTLVVGTLDTLYTSASFVKNGSDCNKIIQKVRTELAQMDITLKLELIKTLMDTYEKGAKCDSLETSEKTIFTVIVTGLVELITKIKSAIEWIEFEIDKHIQKWFSGYRSINFEDKITELKQLITILDGRILLLMNLKKHIN